MKTHVRNVKLLVFPRLNPLVILIITKLTCESRLINLIFLGKQKSGTVENVQKYFRQYLLWHTISNILTLTRSNFSVLSWIVNAVANSSHWFFSASQILASLLCLLNHDTDTGLTQWHYKNSIEFLLTKICIGSIVFFFISYASFAQSVAPNCWSNLREDILFCKVLWFLTHRDLHIANVIKF